MKTRYFIAVTMLSVIAVGCNQSDNADTKEEVIDLPTVELGVASMDDVEQTKTYTATVEADNTNNISPSMMNRIKTITVDVGDRVHKGQVIATLDPSNIDQLKLSLENAQREYNRALQLKEIGAGTQQQVDQLKTQVDAYRSQYNNLMENTVLLSPINGVVTARNYDPGDMTSGLPVVTIGQITPNVKVIINVTENDFTKVKAGMPVKITFDAFPGEDFSGKISRIYPTVDVSTRTFKAEILISNPQGQILPGMFARVDLNLGSQLHVVVPDLAVVKQPGSGNRYVYVYHNGTVSYDKVELGQRIGNLYEVISGVNAGDSVVVQGQAKLADGVKVEVVKTSK